MRIKHHHLLHLSVILLISFLSAVVCRADDLARDRASLRGIKTVVVRVPSFEHEWASELAKAGLKEAVLQASIERQLEKSGITVIPEEASKKTETVGHSQCEDKIFGSRTSQENFFDLGRRENRKARS